MRASSYDEILQKLKLKILNTQKGTQKYLEETIYLNINKR